MKLEVFEKDFTRLGAINSFSFIRYSDLYCGMGSFELHCPLNDNNINLLFGSEERILWLENEIAGFIQYNNRDSSKEEKSIVVRGNLLNQMLEWRYIYPQFDMYDKPDNIAREMVRLQCIADTSRTFPNFDIKTETSIMTTNIHYQVTGSYLNTECISLLEPYNLGYEVAFMPKNKLYQFRVLTGKDRTHGNTQGNQPVIFSSELNNILTSQYTSNLEPFRNTALVAGEDSGTNRKTKLINDTLRGFDRKELFVDARDLQSTKSDSTTYTETEYLELLNQRGLEKLQECVKVESFESTVRNDDKALYHYGVHYNKGDKVTVVDRDLKVSLSALVTGVTVTQDSNGYTVEPTFGYSVPTLNQKLKRKGVF
jgi:hypothetical protein